MRRSWPKRTRNALRPRLRLAFRGASTRLGAMRWPKLPKLPPWVWIAGGFLLLESGRREVEAKITKLSPTSAPGEVPATLTPANASQVANAIVSALRTMGRSVKRQESWLYPLAVSQFETDTPPRQWRQLYNSNVGNVTATGGGS